LIAKDIRDNDENVRKEVFRAFQSNDTNVIREMIFDDPDTYFHALNSIMLSPIRNEVRKRIDAVNEGVVIMNGALIIEFGFLDLCDYQTFVVISPVIEQYMNLRDRGYTLKQMRAMVKSQHSTILKIIDATQFTRLFNKGFVACIKNYTDQTDRDIIIYAERLKRSV
jgi:dephospho-CoA kinase